jgi:hypothetical protein
VAEPEAADGLVNPVGVAPRVCCANLRRELAHRERILVGKRETGKNASIPVCQFARDFYDTIDVEHSIVVYFDG